MSAQRAIAFFVSQGWTPAQAAGIAANLQAESNFRPDAVGDGGQAYGIAQWHPPRQGDFARAFGKSIQGSTLDEQLAFVQWELTNTERRAGDALRGCITAAEAGSCVSVMYERPADAEGEARKRAALAAKLAGEQPAAPIEDKSPPPAPAQPKESKMPFLALLAAFGPVIAQLIPQVAKAVGGGERAQQNVAAAQAIFDTVVKASGQANIQSAVEAMQGDPALVTKVTQAVVTDPVVMQLLEIGGGIAAARVADAQATQADKPFWYSPAFWIVVLLLPLVYLVVSAVVFDVGGKWSDEMRSVVVTAIVAGLLSSITGFYLGSSYGSARKDAALINERKP